MIDFRANIERQLKPYAPYRTGDPLASLIAFKATPGVSEQEGGLPFSGADGLALDKAFGRLGWGFGSKDTRTWMGLLLKPCHYPKLSPDELRTVCEIVDPLVVVALDEEARKVLVEAYAFAAEELSVVLSRGSQCDVLGRHFVSVDGFEDSLNDEATKQKAWAQLKQCTYRSFLES